MSGNKKKIKKNFSLYIVLKYLEIELKFMRQSIVLTVSYLHERTTSVLKSRLRRRSLFMTDCAG